jgi:hypothetical protein
VGGGSLEKKKSSDLIVELLRPFILGENTHIASVVTNGFAIWKLALEYP